MQLCQRQVALELALDEFTLIVSRASTPKEAREMVEKYTLHFTGEDELLHDLMTDAVPATPIDHMMGQE